MKLQQQKLRASGHYQVRAYPERSRQAMKYHEVLTLRHVDQLVRMVTLLRDLWNVLAKNKAEELSKFLRIGLSGRSKLHLHVHAGNMSW